MLKIKVENLRPGVKLGKDIFSYDSQLLLPKGTVITEEHLNSFRLRNITEVFIIEASARQKSERSFQDVFSYSLDVIKSFMIEAKLGKTLDLKDVNKIVDLLVEQVYDVNDIFRQIRLMKNKNKDDYLYTHSINVALLSILIGRWLKLDKEEIKLLGLAGLLHDVGKIFIDSSILNKPDKLTDEEFAEIKKHPSLGYGLLNDYVDEKVAKAVLLHHERIDGSGYPMGLKGKSSLFASVIAVADVFDALTSNRTYSAKISPYTAVDVLWEEAFGKLDPAITKVFCDKITNFYVGNEVILSNGVRGVVIYVDPKQPTRPIIMAGDDFINLAEQRSLFIVEVLD